MLGKNRLLEDVLQNVDLAIVANLKKTNQIINKQESMMQELFGGRILGGTLSQMARYSDLFYRTTEPIFLVELKTYRILECNPAIENILSIQSEQVVGDELLQWIDPAEKKQIQSKLNIAAKSEKTEKPFDATFIAQDGRKVILELHPCKLRLADYLEVLQILTKDVTAMRLAEKELAQMNEKLQAMSITDEMTRLYNFRYFKERLETIHEQAKRHEKSYAIIFCDVDHFKKYNDTNGHPAGDEVLRKVAEILKSTVRKADLTARYGGEEFVVLCPDTNWKRVHRLAERLREAVESEKFFNGTAQPLGKVTISVGVASYPEHAQTFQDVLDSADQALYFAKHSGRNQVRVFDEIQKLKKAA